MHSVIAGIDLNSEMLVQPIKGLKLDPVPANPGDANTVWVKSTDGHLQKGATDLEAGGGGPTHRDLSVGVGAMSNLPVPPGGVGAVLEIDGNQAEVFNFSAASSSVAQGSFRLPDDYLAGSDVQFYIDWSPSTVTVANVRWFGDIVPSNPGSPFGAFQYFSVVAPTNGVIYQHTRTVFPTSIAGTSFLPGTILMFQVARNAPGQPLDTYAGDGLLYRVGIRYQSI